jgi:hypothetical protein
MTTIAIGIPRRSGSGTIWTVSIRAAKAFACMRKNVAAVMRDRATSADLDRSVTESRHGDMNTGSSLSHGARRGRVRRSLCLLILVPALAPLGSPSAAPAGLLPATQTGILPVAQTGILPVAQAGLPAVAQTEIAPLAQVGILPVAQAGVAPLAQAGVVPLAQAGAAPLANANAVAETGHNPQVPPLPAINYPARDLATTPPVPVVIVVPPAQAEAGGPVAPYYYAGGVWGIGPRPARFTPRPHRVGVRLTDHGRTGEHQSNRH